jgi:hypothetical protein
MILLVSMYYGSGGELLMKDMIVMIGRLVDLRRSGKGVLAWAG